MTGPVTQDKNGTGQDFSTGSPGTVLRRCREFHEITLEEASETTKIGMSHLKALEDDRIDEFANLAYLKGFLRIYATFLGLNAEDIARMYDKLSGAPAENPAVVVPPKKRKPQHGRSLIPLKKLFFPALLLGVIILTSVFFKRAPAPLVRQPAPAEPAAVAPVAAIPLAVYSSAKNTRKVNRPDSAVREKKVEEAAPEKPVVQKRQPEAAKGFVLKAVVTNGGTLAVVVDDTGSQQYTLTSGDIFEWKADKKISLDLSNAGGVEIMLNGRPVKSLGPAGKPVYVEFDSEGIKQ